MRLKHPNQVKSMTKNKVKLQVDKLYVNSYNSFFLTERHYCTYSKIPFGQFQLAGKRNRKLDYSYSVINPKNKKILCCRLTDSFSTIDPYRKVDSKNGFSVRNFQSKTQASYPMESSRVIEILDFKRRKQYLSNSDEFF